MRNLACRLGAMRGHPAPRRAEPGIGATLVEPARLQRPAAVRAWRSWPPKAARVLAHPARPSASSIARAQNYPTRPITLIVPFPAGGTTDVIARVMAERMKVSLDQSIIVENVTGANGTIGVGRTDLSAQRARNAAGPLALRLTATQSMWGNGPAMLYPERSTPARAARVCHHDFNLAHSRVISRSSTPPAVPTRP
jgi:hypothetical protein